MTDKAIPQQDLPTRSFGWSTVLVMVGTVAIAGLLLLLVPIAPLAILGTAMIALGFGGRAVMLVGQLKPSTEATVVGLCYSMVVLGAMCFEDMTTRIIVAAVALLIMLVLDAIDSRISASKS